MHDEREEERKRKAIDHCVVPFIALSSLTQVADGKLPAGAQASVFLAHRGKGYIPHALICFY
jgi:hypothetical protein